MIEFETKATNDEWRGEDDDGNPLEQKIEYFFLKEDGFYWHVNTPWFPLSEINEDCEEVDEEAKKFIDWDTLEKGPQKIHTHLGHEYEYRSLDPERRPKADGSSHVNLAGNSVYLLRQH